MNEEQIKTKQNEIYLADREMDLKAYTCYLAQLKKQNLTLWEEEIKQVEKIINERLTPIINYLKAKQ